MPDFGFLPALCAGLAVLCAVYVFADFGIYLSRRYRDRFLDETELELDDILLAMPAGRILDLSLGVTVLGAFLAALLVAWLMPTFSWYGAGIAALVGGLAAFPVPRLVLRTMRRRRLERFNDQLEDALGMMSSALKAGFSIMQALAEVAAGRKRPISLEFRLLIREMQLGVPLEQALNNMTARVRSADLELAALAIITARQTGGELPTTLDRLAVMIRERIRIQQKTRALTAMGRLQVIILSCMPFVLLIGLLRVMPRAAEIFFGSAVGWLALGGVCLLVFCGAMVARKIIRIDV